MSTRQLAEWAAEWGASNLAIEKSRDAYDATPITISAGRWRSLRQWSLLSVMQHHENAFRKQRVAA